MAGWAVAFAAGPYLPPGVTVTVLLKLATLAGVAAMCGLLAWTEGHRYYQTRERTFDVAGSIFPFALVTLAAFADGWLARAGYYSSLHRMQFARS